ncbi:MAG: radical SAM protein [Lentimicrobiaceae bacterium]|jgi:uncharacterized protein|nr:radical SAM protein [Lentimicrobiaceae bacterium]
MKVSRYNFFVTSENNTCYIYNSATNALLSVEKEIYDFLQQSKEYQELILPSDLFDEETVDVLKSANIITQSDENKLNSLYLKTLSNRFDGTKMNLTLVPTQACNFNCIYCYEKIRPNIFMDDETENNIINYVISINPKKLHIAWYGGEPLMNFKSIQKISEALIQKNINFNAIMITNGYLMNKEVLNQLFKLRINSLQITIDGPKEIHDTRRFLLNGKGTFDKIYKNILLLLSLDECKDIALKIRINVDKGNLNTYLKFRDELYDKFSKFNRKVIIYPGWVTGEGNPDISCLTPEDISSFTLNNMEDIYPENEQVECMSRHINSFLIGPTGKMYKCWHNLGHPELELGNLNDKPCIVDSNLLLTRR